MAAYESLRHPLLPWKGFVRRMAWHVGWAAGLVLGSLAIGMCGYRGLEGLAWSDAFLDSAMLLAGMGPIHPPLTLAGKVFAGCYALYAGLVFLVVAGLLLAPAAHRVLHHFHLDSPSESGDSDR